MLSHKVIESFGCYPCKLTTRSVLIEMDGKTLELESGGYFLFVYFQKC